MSIDTTPWRCPKCNNSWFRTETHRRFVMNKHKLVPGMRPLTYQESGEESTKIVCICTKCERTLKEIYEVD